MAAGLRVSRLPIFRKRAGSEPVPSAAPQMSAKSVIEPLDIAPNDPLLAYLVSSPGAVDIQQLELDSPAVRSMKAAGIKLAVPLVSQGELIGMLNLGQRMSEQEYSSDDRALLNNLAAQATPALRVAQLVRQQQAEAKERQRIEQELQVARLIQHTLLPKNLPQVEGWHVAAHYQPARAVGGDFYDFIEMEDGRLGLVVGDVTDKGVPAALVMATTRSVLRAAAASLVEPGAVLRQATNKLCPDIPANMFVTCLFAILDPVEGRVVYANAGHDAPYQRSEEGVVELSARGMPLGLMPDMEYEELETRLAPGDAILFYSDGLVEAHNPDRQMFSFPRLHDLMAEHTVSTPDELVDFLLDSLAGFTGPEWEQEDDITLVTLQRVQNVARYTSFATNMLEEAEGAESNGGREGAETPIPDGLGIGHSNDAMVPEIGPKGGGETWDRIGSFEIPSMPGNERAAIEQVREVLKCIELPARTRERLETAE